MCGERSAETRLGKPPIPKGPVRKPAHWPRWLVVTFLAWAWIGAAASGEDTSKKSPASTGGPKKPAISGRSIYANPEGKARVTLFGLTGEGYKFAYVLDRSASMGGSGREALKVVKAELLESLKALDDVHQFQIIFYNEKPAVFNPSGMRGRLAFATEENKERAVRFIRSIVADGNTRHDDALKLAIHTSPDVIFFLTDGDDPKLTRSDLDRIRRMAAGITIHAIEFGTGPKPAGKSFLAVLAEENGGKYTYVDILEYGSKKSDKPGE
jgi:hypothetical protein